ncbi:MAG: hypothetical protein KY455_03240 [Euryarchaeota archaeon]|nr:hypothetical protein [Euryarchaeota archaeon]
MNRLATALSSIVLVIAAIPFVVAEDAQATTGTTMKFGMGPGSIAAQTNAGIKPDYETFWVGPWTLKSGWGGPNGQMDKMKAAGVTPAIHFYYWGDDISKSCIENGCWSSLHSSHKTKAGWQTLAQQLVDNLNAKMAGKPVIIFLETEFNKGDVQNYDPLDGYLAAKASFIKKHYPNAKVVLALGNWNSGAWHTWDRAASQSDFVGIQGMRGSTRDSLSSYLNLYEATLSGAKKAQSLFGKPIFIHDVALSSYPEPTYLKHQADELRQFFTGMPELKAAGVKAMVYRSWWDNPNFDLANYYGQAERHWGFAYPSSGTWKPAASVWVDGIKAERSGSTTTSTSTTTSSGTFSAAFTPSSSVNEWWIDVAVKSSSSVSKVEVSVNGGSYTALQKNSWGTWSKSLHAPSGSKVVFRATDSGGKTVLSPTFDWLKGTSSTTTTSTFSATFTPSKNVNEWWIDVAVKSSSSVSKVEVSVNGGSYTALQKNSWGTWSKSLHAPSGSKVVFRATDSSGKIATSPTFDWLKGTSSTTTTSSPTTTSTFSATFSPSSNVNEWWIDVGVKSSSSVSKVEVSVNGGSYTGLQKNSWGTWSKSLHAPSGSKVVFRATDSGGKTATSETFTWLQGSSGTSSFTASFTVKSQDNPWWVETSVKGSESVVKVQACIDGKGCTDLSKTSWGTWAKSIHAPSGSKVQFKATGSSGGIATSSTYTWG